MLQGASKRYTVVKSYLLWLNSAMIVAPHRSQYSSGVKACLFPSFDLVPKQKHSNTHKQCIALVISIKNVVLL